MNFDTSSNSDYLMTANHMAVGLNMPRALKGEQLHGLPEYAPRRAFLVDEYPACPKNWKRSEGRMMSYFVPIKLDHGLWLDFNSSLLKVTQHVAVVVSAQGINALTRLPTHDPTLEQYLDTCPKHKIPFGPERYCEKCKRNWGKQNYLTSAAQPPGHFWLDGFRSEDGVIRQYVFTKDQARSVAKAVLGEDRVFALGLSFFLSKTQRPAPPQSGRLSFTSMGSGDYLCCAKGVDNDCGEVPLNAFYEESSLNSVLYDKSVTSSTTDGLMSKKLLSGPSAQWSANLTKSAPSTGENKILKRLLQDDAKGGLCSPTKGRLMSTSAQYCADMAPRAINSVQVQQVEIAAGAKVSQRIYDDPNPLDFYYPEPTALILVNYCLEEDAERIIAAGKKPLPTGEGWPEGLKVGNS